MSDAGRHRGIERVWYGDSSLALLLQPAAWAFGAVAAARRALYRSGWRRAEHPGVPVIVVGNLTVGGTGKTPVVAWLVERLRALGRKPAIVSRGYGGTHTQATRVRTDSRADQVGDEPLLLARRTGVPVVVGRDRVAAARLARTHGADVIVADDGLQHYALARDLEIAVIDGKRQLGNGRLLPAGPLREPAARLGSVDLVLVNGGPAETGRHAFALRLRDAVALGTGASVALGEFAGRKAWAVAGIGNPQRFVEALRERRIDAEPVAVPDHGTADLAALRKRADWPILMTEKDAVKYPQLEDGNAWYLPADLEMTPADEAAVMRKVRAALETASVASQHG